MIKEIKKGDRFVCEKSCNHFYEKGVTYESDKDGCITDDTGNKWHLWDDIKRLNKRFRLISTKTQAGLDMPASCMSARDEFQNYSKEYLDNAKELQAVCDAQGPQRGYTKAEQQFEDVVTDTLKQCQDTMLIKGREYRRNNNPFHNFDKGVEISGQIREEVIWGFALKHFISIQDIRSDLREGKLPSEELLNEKYGDMINYLLIEKASIAARIKGEQ